jgi:hypothetical protein
VRTVSVVGVLLLANISSVAPGTSVSRSWRTLQSVGEFLGKVPSCAKDPRLHRLPRLGEVVNACCQTHSSLRLRKNRSIMPFCSGVYGVMNSCGSR